MIRNYCGYCSIPASSANNTTRSNSTTKQSRCSVMLKLKRIVKSYKETGALNEHLGVFGFVDGHTFITKAGDLGMVLRVEGVDYECLDSREIDNLTKRLESALKLFDPKFRIYQYLFKKNSPPVTQTPVADEVVKAAI